MTPEQKKWIDDASYDQMLHRRRFAPVGDQMFADNEAWDYFCKTMDEKRKGVDVVAASKRVGWGR